MSFIKYAALANKIRLYNGAKGILRVKLAMRAVRPAPFRVRLNRSRMPVMQSYNASTAKYEPTVFTGGGKYGLMVDAEGNLVRQQMSNAKYRAWYEWAQSPAGQRWLTAQDPAAVKSVMGAGWAMPTAAASPTTATTPRRRPTTRRRAPGGTGGAGAPGGTGTPPVSDNPFGDWAARVGWTGLGAAGLYAGMNWLGSDGGYKNSSSYDPAYDPTKNFDSYTGSYGNPSGYTPSRDIVSPWASP